LAVVTGASTGIGYELAKCCRGHGFDLLIAADEPAVMPFGAAFGKGLTLKMGQTHVMRYLRPLLDEIDPSFVITHRLPIDDAPAAYRLFRDKQDACIKVVLKPH